MKPIDSEQLYNDPLDYDAFNSFDHDFNFWLEYAKGSVLDLACGTGRITIPLAEKGIKTTGVDISDNMLKRAKGKAKLKNLNIDLIKGDFRTLELNQKFETIICTYNAFQHLLDLESLQAFFRVIKDHLQPNGKFIFDIFNPDLKYLLNDGKVHPVGEYDNPHDLSQKVILTEVRNYDKSCQIYNDVWKYSINGKTHSVPLNLRIFFPAEIDNYLLMNGFEIIHKYGSFNKDPFTSDSKKQIIVCRIK
ncbi:class I SAM-dependent methyltransferase [soil metagenome]